MAVGLEMKHTEDIASFIPDTQGINIRNHFSLGNDVEAEMNATSQGTGRLVLLLIL